VPLILLGSENVYEWQLAAFAEALPAATFLAWYGHAEMAVFAPWCERSRRYHVWPFYGTVELLDARDQEVAAGQEAELVGTSLHRWVTPFIRYRTMDRAVRGPAGALPAGARFSSSIVSLDAAMRFSSRARGGACP